ncbi:MAG: hypothetical protein IJU37_02405 [Desulfovibrio sp.]|nr:hypothetical protein [Desulfovibrio sp.]
MKITGFTPSELFSFPLVDADREAMATPGAAAHDMVNIQSLRMMDMDDAEAEALLETTMGMIAQDNMAALSVHSGLTASRVAELLSL